MRRSLQNTRTAKCFVGFGIMVLIHLILAILIYHSAIKVNNTQQLQLNEFRITNHDTAKNQPSNCDNPLKLPSNFNISDIQKMKIPGPSNNDKIYVMNTIYLPNDQLVSIHLLGSAFWTLSSKYDKNYALYAAKHPKLSMISMKMQQVRLRLETCKPQCIFQHNSITYTSPAVIVPEAMFAHTKSTITILCNIPKPIMTQHQNTSIKQDIYELVLLTTDRFINIRLSYNIKQRSMFPLTTKFDNPQPDRFLSVCMPRIIEVEAMTFIRENIAYYINQGIDHIYIGTFFRLEESYENNTKQLVDIIRPWYDAGMVTLMNFVMPNQIDIDGGFSGQVQFTIQCLYLAKSFGDEFTFNIDADEFVMFHNGKSIYENLKHEYYNEISNKCWIIFDSYNVWKLTNTKRNYLVRRFTEIDTYKNGLTLYCKSLWNNKYLWSAEVHTGGACNVSNTFGFEWTDKVKNYKDNDFHKFNRTYLKNENNPSKLVKIMNAKTEASIRHFSNARRLRFTLVPREYSVDDKCAIHNIIWNSIKLEFEKRSLDIHLNATYIKHDKYDVLFSGFYKMYYGKNNTMNKMVYKEFNYTENRMRYWAKGSNTSWPPVYDESVGC